MGSFDGAEVCELVGLYLLAQMEELNINIGIYRDDGLAVCDKSPQETENIKKKICQIFKDNNLKITINANFKSCNFLDITLNLNDGTFKPYIKENNNPSYVHKDSNHPPNIIKNIPESINKRLTGISSSENIFNHSKTPYQNALNNSGYDYRLKHNPLPPHQNRNKNNRKRNITWYNPPYSKNVKTNIGHHFLKLIDKHFPQNNPLHTILNRNTIKISYSCMPNMKQIISGHNRAILSKHSTNNNDNNNCNCRNPTQCPLNNQCLTKSIVYQAIVTNTNTGKEETYVGLSENTFKTRFTQHKASFNNNNKRNSTKLSQHIWNLKDNSNTYTLKWKILSQCTPYSPNSKKCNLCIKEKYFIICRPKMSSLNNRNELATECRHRKKYLLGNT